MFRFGKYESNKFKPLLCDKSLSLKSTVIFLTVCTLAMGMIVGYTISELLN